LKVLVVDDEPSIVELVRFNLEREGFATDVASDGREALAAARQGKPDIIVLDVMLPGMDGYEVCRVIRQESSVPIIMLTAKTDEIDRVLGLELGADDYVVKPFSPRELVARVRAIARRLRPSASIASEPLITAGNIFVYPMKHKVEVAGAEITLSPREYDLLKTLAESPGKVFTRDVLLDQLWGYEYFGDTRTVDVHVRRLRQKIGDAGGDPQCIETVHGVGYRFAEHLGPTKTPQPGAGR
jgi:DNA-binding response OmpR family regulator